MFRQFVSYLHFRTLYVLALKFQIKFFRNWSNNVIALVSKLNSLEAPYFYSFLLRRDRIPNYARNLQRNGNEILCISKVSKVLINYISAFSQWNLFFPSRPPNGLTRDKNSRWVLAVGFFKSRRAWTISVRQERRRYLMPSRRRCPHSRVTSLHSSHRRSLGATRGVSAPPWKL